VAKVTEVAKVAQAIFLKLKTHHSKLIIAKSQNVKCTIGNLPPSLLRTLFVVHTMRHFTSTFLPTFRMCSPMSCGPKGTAHKLTRISFGLTLLLVGIAYFVKNPTFAALMAEGISGTAIAPLGQIMAYVLPGLMVVGGLIYVIGAFMEIGAWVTGIALGLFPVLMILKSIVSVEIEPVSVMPFVVYGLAWLILYVLVTKNTGCGSKAACCGTGAGCGCGMAGCHCPSDASCNCGKKTAVVAPASSNSSAPVKAWTPAKTATKTVVPPAKKKA
jgi:uncharacterized membrane protein YphA (DoxX/SURF4 family)